MQCLFIEMGINCSCNKARCKDAVLSRAEPCLTTYKTKTGRGNARQQNDQNSPEAKQREGDFKEAVKESVDIDSTEKEDEPAVPKIKEIKVLPPIRNRPNTAATISYTPRSRWGGSVSSYLGMSHDEPTGRQIRHLLVIQFETSGNSPGIRYLEFSVHPPVQKLVIKISHRRVLPGDQMHLTPRHIREQEKNFPLELPLLTSRCPNYYLCNI